MASEQEDISTEEILASIRSILLEKREADLKEPVFELTKDMVYKKLSALYPDLNLTADEIIEKYADLFADEEKNRSQNARVSAKTDF